MIAVLRILLLVLALATVGSVGVVPPHQAPASAALTADPRVVTGVLPNGMRYALLPNRKDAPEGVAMRLAVDFGSLDEADGERGLAHFIEHMAFKQSRHLGEGELIARLERLGLTFGPDANASTDREHTIYRLDLPKAGEQEAGEALFLLREIAGEITFAPDAVERERGVVLAEIQRRDTADARRSQRLYKFLIPGAYAVDRSPGGDPAVIERASGPQLASLYDRFYRPERVVLVIAGDFDADSMRRSVQERFGSWQAKGTAGARPDTPYTLPARAAEAELLREPAGADWISVYQLRPFDDPPDSIARRREADIYAVGVGVMAQRFARLAQGERPPFRGASLGYVSVLDAADAAVGSVTYRPGAWRPALEALEQEWRRALLHGFTTAEIGEQVEVMREARRTAAAREAARSESELADTLLATTLADAAFTTPASALERFEALAPEITPDAVLDVLRRRLDVETPLFVVSTTDATPESGEAVIEAWRASRGREVQAPADPAQLAWAYGDWGLPGRVVSRTPLGVGDAEAITFVNNVRLNVLRTQAEGSLVLVSLRVAGGEAALSDAAPGLVSMMQAYAVGGLEQHTYADVRRMFAGKAVQPAFGLSASAFGGSYVTSAADLETQLQVAAAYLMHPGYRADAELRWQDAIRTIYRQAQANPQNVLRTKVLRLLASGDRRVGLEEGDGFEQLSFADLRAAIDPWLKTGAIEITIVGDVEEAKAIGAVARTFGALPERSRTWSSYRAARPIAFSHKPIVLNQTGEPGQALTALFWPVAIDPDASPQDVRVLSAAVSILQLKLSAEIRTALGASYSPAASASLSTIYPGWSYVYVLAEVKPDDVAKVQAALRKVAAAMREGDISQDELARALNPAIEQLPAHARLNAYWLSLLSEAQFRPDRRAHLALAEVEAGYRAITVASVVEAARRWLQDEAATPVSILPAK